MYFTVVIQGLGNLFDRWMDVSLSQDRFFRSPQNDFQNYRTITETKLGVNDTPVFLLNEYVVELNPANFDILDQILN